MPGPVVHTIIAEHLPREFESFDSTDNDFSELANDARSHRNALVFGAQGPDPFFFNPNDIVGQPGIATGMTMWSTFRGQLAVGMHELTKPLKNVKEEVKGQLSKTLEDVSEESQLIEESKNLLVRMREVLALAGKILRGFVKKELLDETDPFGFYISPLQTCGMRSYTPSIEDLLPGAEPCGATETSPTMGQWVKYHNHWAWFDNLHSRLTGDFITELLDIATGETEGADGEQRERSLLKSYALGYLSHFAADIVGHSYVNCITGGPYRLNQSQRHTTQEKIMDVWAYNRYYRNEEVPAPVGPNGEEFELELSLEALESTFENRYYRSNEMVDSAMHRNFQFTIGDIDPRDWEPDKTALITKSRQKPIRQALQLPDEIADNVSVAAERAYPDCFGPLNPGEVATSYRAWYKNFMSSTTAFGPDDPDEFPSTDLTGPLKDDLEDLADEGGDVIDAIGDLVDSLFDPETEANLGNAAACAANVVENSFSGEDVGCLEEIAESINNFLTNLATAIGGLFREVAEFAVELVDVLETLAATVTLRVLNFLLQKLYETLFSAYKNLLMLVTAIGFGSMYSEDLHQSQLQNLWNPQAIDASGRTSNEYVIDPETRSKFPRKGMKAAHTPTPAVEDRLKGLTNQAHLLVPFGEGAPGVEIEDVVEQPQTHPGPAVYGEHTPEIFINDPREVAFGGGQLPPQGAIPNPERNGSELRNEPFGLGGVSQAAMNSAQLSADDYYPDDVSDEDDGEDDEDDGGSGPLLEQPIFGDAVSFTVALYARYKNPGAAGLDEGETPIPNLNMSGDRAVGFPTWANKRGYTMEARDRWGWWHGEKVPWLDDDPEIDSVFVPDVGEYY